VKIIRETGQITQEQVLAVFVQIRQLLEQQRRYQSRHPHVNSFCHWVVHSSLHDTHHLLRLLVQISQAISAALMTSEDEGERAATAAAIRVAGNLIDIPRLRSEFVSLCDLNCLDDYLFRSKKSWDSFVALMLSDLLEKPICFRDNLTVSSDRRGKLAKLHDEIMALPNEQNWDKMVKLVLVSGQDGKVHVQLSNPGGKVTYDFELHGSEPEAAFA
jgi:hypothetical protein